MKARRFLFRAPAIFGTPLKYGAPVFIGFTFAITGINANAGDILRGGSAQGNKPNRAAGGAPTPAATDAARANAKDTLARTTKTLAAVRNLQNAARDAAIRNSVNHLGKNPNNPLVNLPAVPNGLALHGLNPLPIHRNGPVPKLPSKPSRTARPPSPSNRPPSRPCSSGGLSTSARKPPSPSTRKPAEPTPANGSHSTRSATPAATPPRSSATSKPTARSI